MQNDEYNDGYLNHYRNWANGQLEYEPLLSAGFREILYRREPESDNRRMTNPEGFPRNIIVREPPGGVSTAASRQKGMDVLSNFFKDSTINRWPPETIVKRDETNLQDYHALDEFFMDEDIERILREEMDEEVLNQDFYGKFTEFARKCWSGAFLPAFARSLGFPTSTS